MAMPAQSASCSARIRITASPFGADPSGNPVPAWIGQQLVDKTVAIMCGMRNGWEVEMSELIKALEVGDATVLEARECLNKWSIQNPDVKTIFVSNTCAHAA